jgi:hypothetical protein
VSLRSFLSWLFHRDEPLSASTVRRIRSDSDREARVRELTEAPRGKRAPEPREPDAPIGRYNVEPSR